MIYLHTNAANLSFPTLSNHPPPRPIVEKFLEDQNRTTCLSQAQQPQQGLATGLKETRWKRSPQPEKPPAIGNKHQNLGCIEEHHTRSHNLSRRFAETRASNAFSGIWGSCITWTTWHSKNVCFQGRVWAMLIKNKLFIHWLLAGLWCWGSRSSMFRFPTLLSATKDSYKVHKFSTCAKNLLAICWFVPWSKVYKWAMVIPPVNGASV